MAYERTHAGVITTVGITTVGISNRAAVKILYATIIPSLIYGMESLYLTKSQYEKLDTFVADALKINPTTEESEIPIWNLFETDMAPPSVGCYDGVVQIFAHYAIFTNEPHCYSSDWLLVR